MSGEPSADSKLSKAQKKNKKRAEKRFHERIEERKTQQPEPDETEQQDPIEILKALLADAKANNDHKLAAKLRQDLWVVQDAYAGMNSDLSSKEIEKTMARVSKIIEMSSPQKPTQKSTKENTTEVESVQPEEKDPEKTSGDSNQKRLRNLKKKLGQIQKLKQRQESGEVLESEQITKIESESLVIKEIEALQEKTS